MLIEFVADGCSDAPLLLIYGYNVEQTRALLHVIKTIRNDLKDRIAIHAIPGFSGVDGVELYFHRSDVERGVTRERDTMQFHCFYTGKGWQQIENLIVPFCALNAKLGRFQWLDETSDISLLFATERHW